MSKIFFNFRKDNKLKEILEEKDYYKSLTMKLKIQFDDLRDKLKHLQEENLKMLEQKRIIEDKQSSTKFASQSIKSSNREKDNEIYNLKEEMKNLELFKQEKPKIDKKTNDLQKQLATSKEDQE